MSNLLVNNQTPTNDCGVSCQLINELEGNASNLVLEKIDQLLFYWLQT